jgi:predicted ferric reductase
MTSAAALVISYAIIIVSPLILAAVVRPSPGAGFIYNLGLGMALMGMVILFLQVLLTGRYKWIERPFGLDMLTRFHKRMGITAAAFLLLHPVLLAAGGAGLQLLISVRTPLMIYVGRAALLLLIISIALSVYRVRLGLTFERWRLSHNLLIPVVIVGGYLHSRFIGQDLTGIYLLRVQWFILLAVTLVAFTHHRIVRPSVLSKSPYRVTDVKKEADQVWTIALEPAAGGPCYDYLPGQFQFITFKRGPHLPVEEHHWTISSSPAQKNYVSSTIKALGDFTSTIGRTKPGDTAVVHAPFGRFSYLLYPEEKHLVFIAGGIGITPFMSMLRHMRDTQADYTVTLLYANVAEAQIVFAEELAQIASGEAPVLELVHVLEQPSQKWRGETGRIDQEKILRYCSHPDILANTYYLCGPSAMSESIIQTLKKLGVSERRIRIEIFSLL